MPGSESREGVFWQQWLLPGILASKALWTAVVLLLVARVTPLRDAEYYLTFSLSSAQESPLRTIVMGVVTRFIRDVAGSDAIVHLVFSLLVGVVLWWLLRDRELQGKGWMLLLLLALPASGIWGSMVSKEVFTIIVSVAFFGFLLRAYEGSGLWLLAAGLALAGITFFRYHYAMGPAWLLLVMLLLKLLSGRLAVVRAILLLLIAAIALAMLFDLEDINRLVDVHVIPQTQNYILGAGEARMTRNWLAWSDHRDFWANLWWGLPFGVIGPLPRETVGRPEIMVMFVGGLLTLATYLACFVLTWRRLGAEPMGRLLFWCGMVPAALVTLLAHYPLSVLNPGSGIRYHVAFAVQLGIGMLAFACVRRGGGKCAD